MTNQTSLFSIMEPTTPTILAETAPTTKIAAQETIRQKSNATKIRRMSKADELDQMYEKLVGGLREYAENAGFERGVLGISGGVDSSLTLKIAVDALGAENITAIMMPQHGLTQEENIEHARLLCEFLGVNFINLAINPHISVFSAAPWKPSITALMNTKARIRTVLLYSYANTENALVLGTSNKSELLLGYGTKYGDMAADLEVLGDLLKTEVIALAQHAGLPPEIVEKTPTAELIAGQTDEQELGATYKDLDKVLAKLELGQTGCIEHGLPQPLVELVFKRVKQNAHKTTVPFVIKAK